MTGKRPGLIHNRPFTVFWLGQALSVLGGSASMLALPLLVLRQACATRRCASRSPG